MDGRRRGQTSSLVTRVVKTVWSGFYRPSSARSRCHGNAWPCQFFSRQLNAIAGSFIVAGARGIAVSFGISEFINAATIVAVGTSIPELATTIVSKFRGYDEVGLGTILGSNIFNGLFIIAAAAIICPIMVGPRDVAVALVWGLLAIVSPSCPWRTHQEKPRRSAVVALCSLFGSYFVSPISINGRFLA